MFCCTAGSVGSPCASVTYIANNCGKPALWIPLISDIVTGPAAASGKTPLGKAHESLGVPLSVIVGLPPAAAGAIVLFGKSVAAPRFPAVSEWIYAKFITLALKLRRVAVIVVDETTLRVVPAATRI